ncbi:M3 family metallopeptidase [Acetobacter sp. AN02]|uniref:M3 family metallopeptidase n=1 Tax=Acetobacter sp. AN02 TaxID=2894186 RepID=UPI002434414A|nr:M3 family metallopeptidase [Acetobacter sp. AN02]MDG6094883.1 M3 family metallopeptidase [Acetobacter sp. AN02]
MRRYGTLPLLSAATLLTGLNTATAAPSAARTSPFATESTLPYHAPRFDLIRDTDYLPAFEQAMKEHDAEIRRIADNPAAPDFDNTIGALEKSGRMLDRVSETFFGVVSANTSPELDRTQEKVAPQLSAHQDSLYLNGKLFERIRTLYEHRDTLGLNPEQKQVLDLYHQDFVHAGAQLSADGQKTLRSLNTKIASLETAFSQKLLAAAKEAALVTDSADKLRGLEKEQIDAAAKAAKERGLNHSWLLPLQNTTQQPALGALEDRSTREALFRQSWLRAENGGKNDTRALIEELAQLRAQKAALFGYKNYAAYVLYDQMAKTPEQATGFIKKLIPATAVNQKREAADLQKLIKDSGGNFALRPWDWSFYADRLKKQRYNLDAAQVRPYFELNTVLQDGVFYAATQLYGITFRKRTDIPVYQPDVMVYEVFDKDGSPLGLMYFDYFARDNKNGGAWMSNFVGQSKALGTKPVIYNVANLPKPAAGQPALISFDDVTTMFHEFGHALHGLFANQDWPAVSGTNVARDFVEFPSQFNEHWALDPKVLAHYARHYKTGAPVPQELAEKIRKSATFNQGYALGEIVAAAQLDLDWHMLTADQPRQKTDEFEKAALSRMGLDTDDVPPRYRSSYFLHIWSNGYPAGYYAYLWTEMLDDDAWSWFRQHGGLTRENGQRFRDMILSRGHTEDYATMFRAFYGKDPDIDPMLRHRGLLPGGD